ncbi:hypothetical protein CDD80_1783 [Ophiocordyceps camponoti-rufipedis]|uniref:Small ribosomal subunit protein mS35 mitochondrial conserved domain-containing protein n=1 Tax=Ophiocordyceps camponoti-rufipedis TaxID=2004952 RepID=A0A2C5Z2R1_9HYPO|nr:hypothetical protein CDD80_1783 [Ophiocordyceps camponoti-rufipedis]
MASAFSISKLCVSASRRLYPLQSHCQTRVVGSRWKSSSGPRRSGRARDREEEEKLQTARRNLPTKTTKEELQALAAQLEALGCGDESDKMARSMTKQTDDLVGEVDGQRRDEKHLFDLVEESERKRSTSRQALWYDEDDPEGDTDELDQFNEDDMMSMAHGKLDEIRDMRHYARLIAWEMPLLSKFAKPFVPPTEDQVLRWRYTTYMGESHPAEKKVVVQFSPTDMGLTPVQMGKLKKLAGPRYDPDKDMVKMSCESYQYPAQNKQYLSDLVQKLLAEARDPTDTFEDVPLDFRHTQTKSKPRFPAEWRMTEDRRRELDERWVEEAKAEKQRQKKGIVDGKKVVDRFCASLDAEEAAKAKKALIAARAGVDDGPAQVDLSAGRQNWSKR